MDIQKVSVTYYYKVIRQHLVYGLSKKIVSIYNERSICVYILSIELDFVCKFAFCDEFDDF